MKLTLSFVQPFLDNLLDVSLEALPFLALGYCIAGLVKMLLPAETVAKYLQQESWSSPIKAALLGVPIPLCSCSVIPVATQLRRSGAGRGPVTAFFISAPETGVDSLSISYAMLGPFVMLARLFSAFATFVLTAWLVAFGSHRIGRKIDETMPQTGPTDCCAPQNIEMRKQTEPCERPKTARLQKLLQKLLNGQCYAFTTLLDDSIKWILAALVITAAIQSYVPFDAFSRFGGSIWSMLLMVAVGFPMYICASASTPVAAGLIAMGISPGSALVFMLAGPASNIATIRSVYHLLGVRATLLYSIGVCGCAIGAGLLFNRLIASYGWNIAGNIGTEPTIPLPLAAGSSFFLLLAAIKPLRLYLGPYLGLERQRKTCS